MERRARNPVGRSPASTGPTTARRQSHLAVASIVAAAILVAACGTSPPVSKPAHGGTTGGTAGGTAGEGTGRRVVQVTAAENFWGSIASQIGAEHAHVASIVTNPYTDPHSYEPTASDARVLATSQLVIENGIGYDPWVPRLLAADGENPKVLNVGNLLGLPDGANPHRWYDPGDVKVVTERITSDLQALDPGDSDYFNQRAQWFENVALAPYHSVIAAIRTSYAGTPVGASESIFSLIAPSLGLDVVTPSSFLKAISEGTEVSAGDKATIDSQIRTHAIRIYVYNSQNVTPDVRAQLNEVRAEHIPYATITETLAPAGTSFQAWQTSQLLGIRAALSRAVPARR